MPGRGAGAAGCVAVCVCARGWVDGGEGCRGEISRTAGGVIVLPDSQSERSSPLSSLASRSPPPVSKLIRSGRGLEIALHTGRDDELPVL